MGRGLAVVLWTLFACGQLSLFGCTTGGVAGGTQRGNDGGSAPVNAREAVEYEKAILRCHKTGGSRVVQIEGQLRCF